MNNAQTSIIIKELCKKQNISVSKMLAETSIRKSLIYDMEKRDYTPSAEILEKIADYLQCSVDYLLGRSNSSQGYSNNHISNSTNVAFGKHSVVSVTEQHNSNKKMTDKLKIKSCGFCFEKTYICPFCNAKIPEKISDTYVKISVSPEECYQMFPEIGASSSQSNHQNAIPSKKSKLNIEFLKCPYCLETSCKIFDIDRNKWIYIYPDNKKQEFFDKVPPDIYKDYLEACSTLHISPNASATLSRRCLQHMIRERWGIEFEKLNSEINKIPKENISRPERKALHAIQKMGNIGAHPNEILEVPVEEAELTIQVIEIFLTKWYIDNPKDEELIASIQDSTKRITK